MYTSNLYPGANEQGIEIKVHDVTIDFNGFRLHGSGQANIGIYGPTAATVAIMNGVIAGFKQIGIIGHDFWVVENMRVLANSEGVKLDDFGRVQRSTLTINDGYGLYCGQSCHVEGNVISKNYEGVHIGSGTVLGNTITHNTFLGITAHDPSSKIGFGNNTLMFNNAAGLLAVGSNTHAQVYGYGVGLTPLHPNACSPAC